VKRFPWTLKCVRPGLKSWCGIGPWILAMFCRDPGQTPKTSVYHITLTYILIRMMIVSPLGQLGLWAPSSRVWNVFTSITHVEKYVFTHFPSSRVGPSSLRARSTL
jgi:hypothetical protein